VDRHLFALAQVKFVTDKLVSHLLDTEAAPEEGTSLSVLREDQVVVIQSSS